MSFDGIFISKLINEVSCLKTGQINKIFGLSKYDYLFVIRSNKTNYNLLLSVHPEYSRFFLTNLDQDKPTTPQGFVMFLRKKLVGARILEVEQYKSDRVIIITLSKYNDLGDLVRYYMITELMGRYSNFIITDENYTILEAVKHISPFEEHQRTIKPGAIYEFPTNSNKIDTLNHEGEFNQYDEVKGYLSNYDGVSKLLINEVIHQKKPIEVVINTPVKPTLIESEKKDYFYFFDLTHITGKRKHFESLSSLLDTYYLNREIKTRDRQKSGDIEKVIKNRIDRNKKKIKNFKIDLENAYDASKYKIIGELLFANIHTLKDKSRKVTVLNYYTNEEQIITLDPLLSIKDNANNYYKKYQKLRNSITHINEQMALSSEQLEYLLIIQDQLKNATHADIDEIKLELFNKKIINSRYLKKNYKAKKPNYKRYISNEGFEIVVGLNNMQNAYITHKLSKPHDIWFHVKDSPGSHVIIRTNGEDVDDETLRLAANISSYYSKYQNSSSVAVDYTKIRYVKKIPGKESCFVRFTNQKTLYIDPDLNEFKDKIVK